MRRPLALALVVLALAGFVGPAAVAQQPEQDAVKKEVASRNATFGIQPSGPEEPDGRGFFTIAATAGAHVSDHLAVRNYSRSPLTLTLQTSDAVNTPTGDFGLLPAGQPRKDVGAWISLPPSVGPVTVPARGMVVV